MIYWTGFTWEAFATLAAGLCAVLAALSVARRQTTIIDRQVRLQELTFRSSIFDRRGKVYNAIRLHIGFVINGRQANAQSLSAYEEFEIAMHTIRFLFSSTLSLEMSALKEFSRVYSQRRLFLYQSQVENSADDIARYSEEIDWRLVELRRRYDLLPELFEKEMSLVSSQGSLSDYLTKSKTSDKVDEMGTKAQSSLALKLLNKITRNG